jgi:hypothetical protein
MAPMKKVQVQLTFEEHAALKMYAATWDTTVTAVIREAVLHTLYAHSACCGKVASIVNSVDVVPDNRRFKECYGYPCRACSHEVECRTGLYQGHWEMKEEFIQYLKPEFQELIKDMRADWETMCSEKAKALKLLNSQFPTPF